jgi:hypothetical protein
MRPHLKEELGVVVYAYHSYYGKKIQIGRTWLRVAWTKGKNLSPK